ncbi:SH3 domain-containing protein [uncultured Tenacibaculum sp.]|uniref:SH3 domain-containing protein n=1 Tax=uncultured Tenacibaculum sp. TaxID=174713 RepID=UPI0026225891|nr:SH3 domain-containing protein [uncultured Tenacibaculum sp.]
MIKNIFLTLIISLSLLSCKNEKDKKTSITTTTSSTSEKTEEIKEAVKPIENETSLKDTIVESKDFYVSKIDKSNVDLSDSQRTLNLYNKTGKVISSLEIDAEFYENDAKVFEIRHHNLDNVNRIITFDVDECPCACACTITKVYILETLDRKYIKLPNVVFDAEEFGEPESYYTFGKKNTIYNTLRRYTYIEGKPKVDLITRQEKLIWNGTEITTKSNLNNNIHIAIAKKGLVVRDKPSLKGNKIDKLPFRSQVIVQNMTDNTLELYDEGKLIKGNWVKVENYSNNNWTTGYVFDGFIEKI